MAIKDLVPKFGRGREKMPARRDEFDPFRGFQREMNRLFDDFFAEDFPLARHWGGRELATGAFSPRVDVSETDKEVNVSAELPGMEEKDLSVEMDDGAITIRGEKKEEKEEKGKNWYTREQSYGSFHRSIALPAGVDVSKAKAKFKNGVLKITAPKREEEQTKRKTINIESD
jgi:HSP20 family protein